MLVRLWNSEENHWGLKEVLVPSQPGTGPSDEYISIENSKVQPGSDGNFTAKDYSEDQINAVHTFAVARLTIDLWEKGLGRKIIWNNTGEISDNRLKIVINKSLTEASYRPSMNTMYLGTYYPGNVSTCMSLDIVSHEATHAVFESTHPGIQDAGDLNVLSIIEGWADVSPMFLQMNHSLLINPIIDIYEINNLSEFAEGLEQTNNGVRNAQNKSVMDSGNPCSIASSFVHLVYIHIAKMRLDTDEDQLFTNNMKTLFRTLVGCIPVSEYSYSTFFSKAKSALEKEH